MAANGVRLIPLDGLNLDVAPQYLKSTQARYIKNLYYELSDLGEAGNEQGANAGVLKPLPSNEIYCPIVLPEGDNHVIGTMPSRGTNELYVFVHNSLENHSIFRVNGLYATGEIVKIDRCFNFQLKPEYFIGEGQVHLEVIYINDPESGEQVVKKDLYWTDGFGYQGYLRVDDSIETNGFDENLYPYFEGDYDRCSLVRMGLPTPNDCIQISEVIFNPVTDTGKNNSIKNTTWQFRISDVDVFGRPSEHGMISDLYYVSSNECLSASDMLSRCVNLTFDAGNPFVDKKQIEYRNCNDEQWYLDSVLELYQGSNLGKWWLRERNPDINYNSDSNKITYTFCKDKLCDPIDTKETNRTQSGQPRFSQSVSKIGKEIALANNEDGFPPFSRNEILNKISVEVVKPISNENGNTANITIWCRIYNPFRKGFQKVWKKNNDYVFGGIVTNDKRIDDVKSGYQQYFAVEGQKGYVGYLAGTSNYAVGVQYYLDDNNNFVKDEEFNFDISRKYYLRFEYLGVPKQVYLFRLASHLANPNEVDIRTTSTYVGGVYAFNNFELGNQITYNKELVVDVCNSDYDTFEKKEMLLPFDMTHPRGGAGDRVFSDNTVVDGYVYENQNLDTQELENPVSLLQLSVSVYQGALAGSHSNTNSIITDHNGFYFAGSLGAPITVSMIGYCNCVKKVLVRSSSGNNLQRYTANMVIGSKTFHQGIKYTYNTPASLCTDFETYPCSRILIKGRVLLCNSGTPVPNLNVVLSRGGLGITDANGEFTITAYDNPINGFRSDKLYIIGANCVFTSCDGGCIEYKTVSINPCNSCNERIIEVGDYEVSFINNRGLLSNGRYGISLTGYDWLGRHGFAQTTDNLYFNTPSLNETKTFAPSTVNVFIPPEITFPEWVDYVTIGITVELNYGGNYISWIANKVEFVDNSGKVNLSAPTQIKIWYNSLNEYNVNNNFNTTTGWGIVPESTTSPRTSDIVQFIRNGDGTFFENPISALIKYDQQGQYFLINYVDALKDLKENSLIRLANPNDCANKDAFFELCGKYKVVNGKIQQNLITLNAFDTYYQYRQIPVPVTSGSGEDEVTIIELRQFGFPFEHPSVTDFWGDKCWNIGRFNVRNPYEAEILHLNQVALSGVISPNAQLNYLNYFDEDQKVDFNVNDTGGIVYVRIKTGMVLIVCQFKNFIVGFNDNVARLNSENIVVVPSGENKFGLPERNTSADYGCQLFDKSTIREMEGLVHFLDRNRVAILQNNFQTTIDVSRYNPKNSTIVSWLTKKIKYQQKYNLGNNDKRYFHSAINPQNFEWVLSEYSIGSNDFINSERGENVSKHETISFDIFAKVWKSFYSFTPEYMSFLEGANDGQLFFYFKNGIPYSNSLLNNTSFNKFFGVQCERIYRTIFNTDGFKKKKFQSIAVYCPQSMYFSDKIITENKQLSRILKRYFKKAEYMWSAPFLCDTKDGSKVTDSDTLTGSWIDIRLVGDKEKDNIYSELYGIIVFAVGEEQTGTQ